jgi:hypothetical protein
MKMKRLIILPIILLVTAGCGENKQSTDDIIMVDVTKNYPKKELILQDFMDVEYIPLETNNEFITQGHIQDIGKDIIVVRNRNNDGDIFIFDRNGKALKKINRKGQGGEEYTGILGITLDEDSGEMFVNDYLTKRIIVYDLDGNFKRVLKHKEGAMYTEVGSFDRRNLICHDGLNDNSTSSINTGQSFMIISKQDGSITGEIQIPFKEKKSIVMKYKDEASGLTYAYSPSTVHPLVPCFDSWILVELSADTVYRYSPDHRMEPFITRIPSVHSMDPEVFLLLSLITDRYYFMETVKKELPEFPATDLLYDGQEKAIFRYTVYNGDYSNKEQAFLKSMPVNNEIPSRQILEAYKLVEDYGKGRLKGKLEEIAAELDEDSNPVIMLIKHKK